MAIERWRVSVRLIARLGCVLLALVAGGCNRVDSETAAAIAAIKDGSAQAALQRHLDQQPQCAPVLERGGGTASLEAGDHNLGAAALVAAGLIEPVPGNPDPHRRNYRPAAAARKWFRNLNPTDQQELYLCFARREVVQISLVPDDGTPKLLYTYTLNNPPPWMAREDIVAAFPGVAPAFGTDFVSDEHVSFDNGKLVFNKSVVDRFQSPTLPYGVSFHGLRRH